jgi:DNA-binding GntR family transcriptional regulator
MQIVRVLMIDGEPGAGMRDGVLQDVECPRQAESEAVGEGEMVPDLLLNAGTPVAYTRAPVTARVLTKRDQSEKALEVDEPVAALEIEHVTRTAEGTSVEHSNDIFLLRSLDLHVMRWVEDMPPVSAIGRCSGGNVFAAARLHAPRRVVSSPSVGRAEWS